MMTRKLAIWWLSWLLVIAAAFPLSAAPPLDPARPAAGRDTVVMGVSLEPVTLNPITVSSASPSILQTIFTRDVQRDADWKPFAQGVENLPGVHQGTWRLNGEQMILRWTLRPRKWHDGRPVTCSDYVFSQALQRIDKIPGVTLLTAPLIANVSCPNGVGGTEVSRIELPLWSIFFPALSTSSVPLASSFNRLSSWSAGLPARSMSFSCPP